MSNPLRFGIIIPARFASTRFPGKPLQDLGGKTLIERVVDAAKLANPQAGIAVATDDIRIAEHLADKCRVLMTKNTHPSGTDRCAEAFEQLQWDCDVVVNLQGDEPFIQADQVALLLSAFEDSNIDIATLKIAIKDSEDIADPNIVKVVCDKNDKALYFSRASIPFKRSITNEVQHFRHIGMYAFRCTALQNIASLKPSMLEITELLEQLRWLENGLSIGVKETHWASPAIDTPEDLAKALKFL
ncbi:MAG: 3-deoxy-manno-octulosonate cytidylyltransferase [Flavobacteriales bacterium]|nr:MAG: 3-deoxy-manno-octulosonate cytidylyltransferase [Flavobacteriales bacterium]